LLLVTLVPSALAVELRDGARIGVEAGEVVEDDVILTGVDVEIKGTVKGDVIAFAQSVTVDGAIEGNLVAAGAAVDVRGQVAGTVYAAGEDVRITGNVGNSVVTVGETLAINPAATIGGNWISFGERLQSEGHIGRGVFAFARSLRLNGPVAKDVEAWTEALTLASGAAIAGGVTYHSPEEAVVEPGAQMGALEWVPESIQFNWDFDLAPFRAVDLALQFTGFLIVGLILLALFPRLRLRFHRAVVTKPWQSPLVGLGLLLATPIAVILLMVTIVGIPLGFIALLVYPLAIYFGQVLLSFSVGRLIADRWQWLGGQHWAMIFLIGALVTTLLTEIPLISFALGFIAVLYGLGGLFYAYTEKEGQAA
jgi:cytoskeletal protein CcmA (bactofilin family)